MGLVEVKINYTEIKKRIDAAELLQEAGQDDAAKDVIMSLAREIVDGH